MARPIPQIDKDLSKLHEHDIKPQETKSLIDFTVDTIRNKSTKNLVLGTISVRPGPAVPEDPKPAVIPKPEPFKSEEPFDKPGLAFLPSKPIPHSPKISPSSIPNPNPSVTANKPEPGYPSYGGFLYNIPGYSAFQPVNFSNPVQPPATPMRTEPSKTEFKPFPPKTSRETKEPVEENTKETTDSNEPQNPRKTDEAPKQQDFEEHFTPEIIPAVSKPDASKSQVIDSQMNTTSLAQGSAGSVSIPQVSKDPKKKSERYSLKTSIPISKIDMKCVSSPVDTAFQNAIKKPVFNPAFQKESIERPKLEIQSNVVIKTATKEGEPKESTPNTPVTVVHSNSISTLINAAEAINKNDGQFRVPEPKVDISKETKEASPIDTQSPPVPRSMFNPVSVESTKPNFPNKPPEGGFNEKKNQLVLLQNKNPPNPKMLLTIQQNPQVLLQRANFESKNLQAPSRLSSQSKKSKDEVIAEASSKVVALKRLHQDNCDENDFENLITENQIYGNKIVVKEKSQGTQQEDWKNKIKIDIKLDKTQSEGKNIVLQPNFVYLSNVQFPGNLMMIKNSSKICQTTDSTKVKVSPNENRATDANVILNNNNQESNAVAKNPKTQNFVVNKDIHVLKSSNNVLQTLSNNNNKTDVVFQTNQKVIMTPQVLYQMPIVVTEAENKTLVKEPKISIQKKDISKPVETKPDKVIIACQVDAKIPKIVIANLRPRVAKQEEVSMLDLYEQKKRLKRLKYLSNASKDIPKTDSNQASKKTPTKAQINVITPDKMKAEIFKEFSYVKGRVVCDTDSDSDYGEDELIEYNSLIEKYGANYNENAKVEFLASFNLASKEVFREKQLERHERTLKCDAIASAYIAAGRLNPPEDQSQGPGISLEARPCPEENKFNKQKKSLFLAHLKLMQVSPKYKAEYEKSWREILRERNRRNGIASPPEPFDPDGHLQILTEIKKSVNENNDLIKKRLDSLDDENSDIRILAEKNFSELNRLSKMADRSVKLFSGKDTKKRDLNPGFDSENIKKLKLEPTDYPKLNIPNISKIISLKTDEDSVSVVTTQATSMDEPCNSASCGVEMTKEVGCQVDEKMSWPGFDTFIKTFREYEKARKKEIDDLHRSNTRLRVECAHITRSASRDSDRARALLAERRHLAGEEAFLRNSLDKLTKAIDAVRRS